MDGSATIMWNIFFGSMALGYFIYGRRQQRGIPLLSGAGLFLLPYLVSHTLLMIIIGMILMALPFFIKH